jgi:hypothetical protein
MPRSRKGESATHAISTIADGIPQEELPGIPSIVDTLWRHTSGDREPAREVPTRTGRFTGREISIPLRTLEKCHVCNTTTGLRVCNSCASVTSLSFQTTASNS